MPSEQNKNKTDKQYINTAFTFDSCKLLLLSSRAYYIKCMTVHALSFFFLLATKLHTQRQRWFIRMLLMMRFRILYKHLHWCKVQSKREAHATKTTPNDRAERESESDREREGERSQRLTVKKNRWWCVKSEQRKCRLPMPQSTANSMVQQRHEIQIKNANNANKCKIITQKFLTRFMDLSFEYHEQTHSVCVCSTPCSVYVEQ